MEWGNAKKSRFPGRVRLRVEGSDVLVVCSLQRPRPRLRGWGHPQALLARSTESFSASPFFTGLHKVIQYSRAGERLVWSHKTVSSRDLDGIEASSSSSSSGSSSLLKNTMDGPAHPIPSNPHDPICSNSSQPGLACVTRDGGPWLNVAHFVLIGRR